jgi:hypothetical protein
MPRQKTGGRTAGTPNKRTLAIEEKLAALGCDPIQGMARLALDESEPSALRFAAMKELAQYVAPKRKAMEISGLEEAPAPMAAPTMTPQEFEEIARRLLQEV